MLTYVTFTFSVPIKTFRVYNIQPNWEEWPVQGFVFSYENEETYLPYRMLETVEVVQLDVEGGAEWANKYAYRGVRFIR